MSLSTAQYDAIMREYEERRIENRHRSEEHLQEIYDLIPEYKLISDSITDTAISLGKKRILGDKSAVALLSEEIEKKVLRKKQLLAEYGFPKDYADPIYTCEECKDTGYVNSKKCNCLKQHILRVLYAQSNIEEVLERENFSTLTYDYYNESEIEQMKKIVKRCEKFVDDFRGSEEGDNMSQENGQNMLLYGHSGVGKTFLSNCIAKAIIDKGYSVIYFTSYALFDTLSKYTFAYDSTEELVAMREDIFSCDLLIIDDLGTENTNSFVTSQLFLVVNERCIRNKSTIISTNLSIEELSNRYTERVLSRIVGNYTIIKPEIQDIRFKIKNIR